MSDTGFVDVIKEENLKKINIDERLVEAFKLAMVKMQEYFNKHNYANGIKYTQFFNKYLLEDSERKLKIIVSDDLKEGAAGSYDSVNCSIKVSRDFVNSDINELAHIICHEFIHFITHHENDILFGDKWGGEHFVDEGLTEQLAREVIPAGIEYHGQQILEFYDKDKNKARLYYNSINLSDRDALLANKQRLEKELKEKITSKMIR